MTVFPNLPPLTQRWIAHSFDPELGERVRRTLTTLPVDRADLLADCQRRLLTLKGRIRTALMPSRSNGTNRINQLHDQFSRELSAHSARLGRRIRRLRGQSVQSRRTSARSFDRHDSSGRLWELDRHYAELASVMRQAFETVVVLDDLRSTQILLDGMALLDRHRAQLKLLMVN